MTLLNLGWAVCFLPLAFIVLSYAVETRRAIAVTLTVGAMLVVVAAVLLLGFELAQGRPTYQNTVPVFTYPVIQTPFNAATRTLLAATLQPSVGILVDPLSVTLALAVSVSALTLQCFLLSTSRAAGQTVVLHRAVALATAAALGLVLAPGYVQAAAAVGLLALAGYLAAADDAHTVGLRIAARRLFLAGWLAAVGLVLAAVFLDAKFSGAIEAAATSGRHPSATYADGFSFVALAGRWLAAPHGTVTGVGARSLVLAAVLELAAAAVLVAAVALTAVSRRATSAAGVATAWIAVVGLGLGGVAVLSRTVVLLEVATHVLPAVVVAAAAAAAGFAVLAFRTGPLDRRVLWLAASGVATAVVGVGLGTVAGAAALAATVALATPAVLGALGVMAARGGGPRPSWLAMRSQGPVGWACLLGCLALGGGVGMGAFFARSAILGAAWAARLPAGTAIDPVARLLAGVGVVVAGAAAAAAVARGLAPIPEPQPASPRRHPRRPHARPDRGGRTLAPALLGAAGLALVSGLAVLPGVGPSLGAFVATPPGGPGLPVNGAALLLTLALPAAAAWVGWRGRLGPARPPVGQTDGLRPPSVELGGGPDPARPAAAALALGGLGAAERVLLTAPGRALLAVDARIEGAGFQAVGDAVRGAAGWLDRVCLWRREAAAAATVATFVLAVAGFALWVGLHHAGGAAP